MRRRVRARQAGTLTPFTPPAGDAHTQIAAWLAWDVKMRAYELAHPEQEDECDWVRDQSIVPDGPFDPDDI